MKEKLLFTLIASNKQNKKKVSTNAEKKQF